MALTQGYNGSVHAPTSERASEVKQRGHKKEDILAERLGYSVVKGTQKPDIVGGEDRISLKGASKNIQLYLSTLKKSAVIYGEECPLYKFQQAGYYQKKFKLDNNNMIDSDIFNFFIKFANEAAEYLRDKNNFRAVITKVFSDNYDANKLAVMLEIDSPAYIYDMKEVVDLYVNSDYSVHVTKGGKIVVTADNKEIFYLEIRGGKDHCGSMNHGVRSKGLYPFLQENLSYEVVPA